MNEMNKDKIEGKKDLAGKSKENSFDKKGKKKGFKPRGKGFTGKDKPDWVVPGKHNDPKWYFKYPELAENVARIAFSHRNGKSISWRVGPMSNAAMNIDPLLTYLWIPTPGPSVDSHSAINLMSNAAWKMLNRRFRGIGKYQAADFGIIEFAILDFMTSLCEAERIYGILNYYALNNTQVPKALMINLHYDPEGFANIADYRVSLNKLILAAKSLCLVKGYSLLDHYLFLANNVFRDRNTERAQLFAFQKAGYWYFDPTTPNGSGLLFKDFTASTRYHDGGVLASNLRTADDILNDLRYQLDALLLDDNVDDVCSDVLAFFGNKEDAAEIVRLGLVPEDYRIEPVFAEEIVRQVHNLTTFGDYGLINTARPGVHVNFQKYHSNIPVSFTGYTSPSTPVMIYQENNCIKFNIQFCENNTETVYSSTSYSATYTPYSGNTYSKYWVEASLIDTDVLSPSVQDVMEMTRLISYTQQDSYVNAGTPTGAHLNAVAFASVLVIGIQRFRFVGNQSYSYSTYSGADTTAKHVLSPSSAVLDVFLSGMSAADQIAEIIKFDWAPIVYPLVSGRPCVAGELDNYVTSNVTLITPMHDIALMSEFKNPVIDLLVKD